MNLPGNCIANRIFSGEEINPNKQKPQIPKKSVTLLCYSIWRHTIFVASHIYFITIVMPTFFQTPNSNFRRNKSKQTKPKIPQICDASVLFNLTSYNIHCITRLFHYHCHGNVLQNTELQNNVTKTFQPKADKCPTSHFFKFCFTV